MILYTNGTKLCRFVYGSKLCRFGSVLIQRRFILSFSYENQADSIGVFNSTSQYLDDNKY